MTLKQTTLDGNTLILEQYKKLRNERVYVKWPEGTKHIPVAFRVSTHWNKGASVVGRAYDTFGLVYLGTWYNWIKQGYKMDPAEFNLTFMVRDLIRIFYHEFFHLWFRKRLPQKDRNGIILNDRKIQDYKGNSKVWEDNETIVDNVAKIFADEELNYIDNLLDYLNLFEELEDPFR